MKAIAKTALLTLVIVLGLLLMGFVAYILGYHKHATTAAKLCDNLGYWAVYHPDPSKNLYYQCSKIEEPLLKKSSYKGYL